MTDVPQVITPEEQQDILRKMYGAFDKSPLLWGLFMFKHYFRDDTPPFHANLIQLALLHKRLAVAAPRGSAKSTILAFLYVFWSIAFKKHRFIVIVSSKESKSVQALASIKNELRDNNEIKMFHSNIKITRDKEMDSIFKIDDWDCRVLCVGKDQIGDVRGEKFRAYRPSLILGDDIEDDELVKNDERRIDFEQLFNEALIQAGDKDTQVIMIGTVLHHDSQIAKLLNKEIYKEYVKIKYRALRKKKDGTYYSIWPERLPLDFLMDLKLNKPDVFAKEYQNNPTYGKEAKFHKSQFRYWDKKDNRFVLYNQDGSVHSVFEPSECKAAIAVDLAWEEDKSHDFTVIMPAFLTPNSDILVDKYIRKKGFRPHEIEEALFNMVEGLEALTKSSVPIGFEKAKMEKIIKHLLSRAMRTRNKFLILKELQWDGDKNERIETRLEPRYATGSIYHARGLGEYEEELSHFPRGSHDDTLDTAQGLCQLLKIGKEARKIQEPEDEFMKLRQRIVDKKNPKTNSGFTHFSSKSKSIFSIPFKVYK